MADIDELVESLGSSEGAGGIKSPFALPPPEPYKKSSDVAPIAGQRFINPVRDKIRIEHRTFITYIPYRYCGICKAEIAEEKVVIPENGRYICPHTDIVEYVELLNKRARDEIKVGEHVRTVLKEGTEQVTVTWGTVIKNNKNDPQRGLPPL